VSQEPSGSRRSSRPARARPDAPEPRCCPIQRLPAHRGCSRARRSGARRGSARWCSNPQRPTGRPSMTPRRLREERVLHPPANMAGEPAPQASEPQRPGSRDPPRARARARRRRFPARPRLRPTNPRRPVATAARATPRRAVGDDRAPTQAAPRSPTGTRLRDRAGPRRKEPGDRGPNSSTPPTAPRPGTDRRKSDTNSDASCRPARTARRPVGPPRGPATRPPGPMRAAADNDVG